MKPEWPMEISVGIPKEDLPEDISYATQSFAVVPAEWYDKRTDLARELYEAARPYHDKAAPHEDLFNAQDYHNFERLSTALARYEREVDDEH